MNTIEIGEVVEKSSDSFKLYKYPFENFNVVQSSVLDHVDKDANFIIASSTNSGKTIVAEFFIFESLIKNDKKCIYMCPLKSLASEKFSAWSSEDHPFSKKKITIMAGDEKKEKDGDLVVATIESFCHNVRTNPNVFDDIDTIIVDEAHMIGSDDRGPTLEFALTEFARKNNSKIIFLSGTLPNANQIGEWLHDLNKKKTYILNSNYQAVPLKIHYKKFDTSLSSGGIPHDMFDCISILCDKHQADKILVFVHSKNIGKKLVSYIKSKGFDTKFHSADLSPSRRKTLEKEFKEGALRILVATSTLAAGVNLPARRVIIAGVVRGKELVDKSEIRQMIGRAGRKGIDDQGDAYVFFPDNKITLANEYKKVDDALSKLFNLNDDLEYNKLAIHILAMIHQEKKLTFDKIWNMLSKTFGGFLNKVNSNYLKNTLDRLEHMKFVVIDDDGNYNLKKLGLPSVLFFIDPYDLNCWIKSFSRYFAGSVRKDSILTYYLAFTPSNNKNFMSEDEKNFCSLYMQRLQELLGRNYIETGSVKIGYLYYCMMNKRSTGMLSPLIPVIVKDFGRICACLSLVSKICGWNCGDSFFSDLKNRFSKKEV